MEESALGGLDTVPSKSLLCILRGVPLNRCEHYSFWRQLAIMATQVIVAAIQFLRIYALYGRNRRIATAVISVALTLIGSSGRSGPSRARRRGYHWWRDVSSRHRNKHIAVAWEALFTFDSLIFILTLAKTYKERANYDFTGRANLVNLIVRDGFPPEQIYRVDVDTHAARRVMVLAQGANVITFYVCPPPPARPPRLPLNPLLRNTDIFATTLDGTSAYTSDSSMEFTTRPGTTTLDSENDDGGLHHGSGRSRASRRMWGFVPVELTTFKSVSSGTSPLDYREGVGVV
ncbi:hypothetical protein BDW22DRAFT_1345436 [Trametopsis cervina]|nr:hypothetical protein BDW22DRAFT_1345436 [Trametopsis cervina]